MKLDAAIPPISLKDVPSIAKAAEAIGFDMLWSSETAHDPFLTSTLIAEHTQRIHVGTSVAIAFARSPANVAYMAWDLADLSKGRFILGLGTQVKAHIERRFGMPWPDSVVGKLREQIQAMHAFWHTWQSGERLNFRGEYYKLTLMTPFFNPGPIEQPHVPVYIAGVNKGLARLAGEVADGFLVHPLHTPAYLRQILLPVIWKSAQKHNRSRSDIKISVSAFVATTPEEKFFVRSQISFYASTPSYRPVMKLHGWEDTASRLSQLAARGKWDEMPALINDDMLDKFAVVSSENDLPYKLISRYQDIADRITLYTPFLPGEKDHFWKDCIKILGEND